MEYSEFGDAFEEVRGAREIGLEKGESVDGLFARCPRSIKRF